MLYAQRGFYHFLIYNLINEGLKELKGECKGLKGRMLCQ